MNSEQTNPSGASGLPASDDEILAGVERHLAGVESLVPAAPAWLPALRPGVRPAAGLWARGSSSRRGLLPVAAALGLAAMVIAFSLGTQYGSCNAACQNAATPTATPILRLHYWVFPLSGAEVTMAERLTTAEVLVDRLEALGATGDVVAGVTETAEGSPYVDIEFGSFDRLDSFRSWLTARGGWQFVPLPPELYGKQDPSTGQRVGGKLPLPVVGDQLDPSLPALFTDADVDREAVYSDCTMAVNPCSTAAYGISIGFLPSATARFQDWTRNHQNEYALFVLDGRVIFVAGRGKVMNSLDAQGLTAVLKSGRLPVTLEEFR